MRMRFITICYYSHSWLLGKGPCRWFDFDTPLLIFAFRNTSLLALIRISYYCFLLNTTTRHLISRFHRGGSIICSGAKQARKRKSAPLHCHTKFGMAARGGPHGKPKRNDTMIKRAFSFNRLQHLQDFVLMLSSQLSGALPRAGAHFPLVTITTTATASGYSIHRRRDGGDQAPHVLRMTESSRGGRWRWIGTHAWNARVE